MSTFADVYAASYDDLYAEKDYERECTYIIGAVERHGTPPPRRILDLGCGTGGHALVLARHGYAVQGVDRSTAMIEIARRKSRDAGVDAEFEVGDARTVRVDEQFDVVLFMFAVLGYLMETADLVAALRNARSHIRRDGLLIFDVWNGPAVLCLGPQERGRVARASDRTTIRISQPRLRAGSNAVDVRIRTWQLDGRQLVAESDEVHSVRYFFQPELRGYLSEAGFEALAFHAFPDLDTAPSESDWNIGCVAVAR